MGVGTSEDWGGEGPMLQVVYKAELNSWPIPGHWVEAGEEKKKRPRVGHAAQRNICLICVSSWA